MTTTRKKTFTGVFVLKDVYDVQVPGLGKDESNEYWCSIYAHPGVIWDYASGNWDRPWACIRCGERFEEVEEIHKDETR